jgi:hypothetical protein
VAGPILGIDFLRKFKVKVVSETSHVLFACPATILSVPPRLSSSVPEAVPPFTRPTFSQPPAISAQLVRNPEVKSFSLSLRNDQSFLDPTPSVLVVPECVPADVKRLLQIHSSILRTGDVMPMVSSITFIPAATPLFLQKPATLIHKNLKLPKLNLKS